MWLSDLWITNFRNYAEAHLQLGEGLSVVVGDNGEGKTSLLEAIGYLATARSFRGSPNEALIRSGSESAIVRAEGAAGERTVLLEAELQLNGRNRMLVNRQPVRRTRDLPDALRVTIFSPDDLVLVKSGPAERRRYLDDLLSSMHPRYAALVADAEKILRQRNALLKQAGGRATAEVSATLDVWDEKYGVTGEQLAEAREELVHRLEPIVAKSYNQLAGGGVHTSMQYARSWSGNLRDALNDGRTDDLRRGVTLTGPHRDEMTLSIRELPARTHASQGEQRSMALGLRLAGHAAVLEMTGRPPVLLLDDVFSELDPGRSAALVEHLPPGQAVLTTAAEIPAGLSPERVARVRDGRIVS